MARGRFITFEGPEGAGKSTQLALLVKWLRQQGTEPVVTREPGGTPMGDRIRAAMFGASYADGESYADGALPGKKALGPRDHGILPLTEALLMSAARAQHVEELLRPALAAGKLVLCDRYADATLAYQGYGRDLDRDMLRQLIAIATGGLQPDLTVYFDVPAEVGLGRKLQAHGNGGELNHLDRMDVAFHERVVAGYRALIDAEPGRWRVIDATRPLEAVQADVREAIASPSS
ncbi:MAG: dTMP kinase [Chloroflexota bacterium]